MRIRQHRKTLIARIGRINSGIQVVLLLITAAYWYVQIAEGANYRQMADENRLRKLSAEAPRGLIRDRHHRPLVENVPSYSLYIDRTRSEGDAGLRFAAQVLDVPVQDLEAVLETHRRTPRFQPVRLAAQLTLTQVSQLEALKLELPELEIVVEHLRLYRHAGQTAHLLGYLGEIDESRLRSEGSDYRSGDQVGKKGVEEIYEATLRGQRGEHIVVVDSRGRVVGEQEQISAVAGQDVTLTIDLDLQQTAVQQLEGRVGSIVALDPRNGQILAMVSSPAFDSNLFARRLRPEEWQQLVSDPNHPLQNRAIQNTYPPGSVFKIVMALAGLDQGKIDPQQTRVFCPGYSTLYNNRYRCWRAGGHGWVNLETSLRYSCNVYYHSLSQQLDIDQISHYARMFGLGRKTAIDLKGEKAGLVPSKAWSLEARGTPWYAGETISVATGQGPILVTPLQVAVMLAATANGGYLVHPHLAIDAQTPSPHDPRDQLPLQPEHLNLVREALRSTVHHPEGTGREVRIDGLQVAGKTGTAQVIAQEVRTTNDELAPEHRDHAWFASYAPVDDPQLVVVVFVEHGGGGSTAAAPLAKAVFEKHFELELESTRGGP